MKRDPPAANMTRCMLLLCWVFLGTFHYAASKPVGGQGINCSVTKRDGQTRYQLSVDPQCEYSWEDANRTVLSTEAEYDPNRVVHRDARSITIRGCLDWLHLECTSKNGEAVCSTNCSAQSPEVVLNAGTTLVVVCVSVALLALIFVGLLLYCCKGRILRAYNKVLEWNAASPGIRPSVTQQATKSYVEVMKEENIV